jgi:enediyne biosynthesis protein E4
MFIRNAAVLVAVLYAAACDKPAPAGARPKSPFPGTGAASAVSDPKFLFTEIIGDIGFQHEPPQYPDGTFMAPEITPGGVAIFDANNDGRLDILVVRHPAPLAPWTEELKTTAPNRFFRQQPDGRFVEVLDTALAGKGFHHGVAIGDVNNDGWQDVYICNFGGPDEFFLSKGDGTFVEATAASGFLAGKTAILNSPDNWSSTAAFFDADADGDLDLWVVHFATFDPKQFCKATVNTELRDYCGPHTFPGQLATLWRNDGAGNFTDITAEAGITAPGRGWGVIAADLTGDGLADVFQANDEEPNQLWVNQGGGKFVDEALLRGAAVNAFGSVEANMGITVGDTRNTGAGRFDVFITHFGGETNTIWSADKDGAFADTTRSAGMGGIDRPFTGWGTGFLDYDNDGFLDLAVANGRVARGHVRPEATLGPFWSLFAEPNLLFRGDGTGRFADVSHLAGDFTKKYEVHRALAFADLHNRGRVDLIGVNLDNTLRVWRNDAVPAKHHWLQILPMLEKREALGAIVTLGWAGKKRSALCLRSHSYLASNDPRVHFGLGESASVESLEIVWPSGTPRIERFQVGVVDQVLVVRQGTGTAK